MHPKREKIGYFVVALLGLILAGITVVGDAYAIIGRPLTPMSYAGVARRTVRRGAYYNYYY